MSKEQLTAAIAAAGEELQDKHGWALDDDNEKPVMETLFAEVLMKHFEPALDPRAAEAERRARIAALRAELAELESRNSETANITRRDREVWRAAITLANNICVMRSDDCNADDGPLDQVREASDCANAIRAWIKPTDDQLAAMFAEAGVLRGA